MPLSNLAEKNFYNSNPIPTKFKENPKIVSYTDAIAVF